MHLVVSSSRFYQDMVSQGDHVLKLLLIALKVGQKVSVGSLMLSILLETGPHLHGVLCCCSLSLASGLPLLKPGYLPAPVGAPSPIGT